MKDSERGKEEMKKYISIDIGGTAIKYGIVSENAEVLLKKEMKTKEFKKIIPQKLRYMSYLSSYCPGIMKIIYKIYDLKTGASKKYAINEE